MMPVQISLRAARVNAGLTLLDGAKVIGISKDTLIKWERNPGLVNPIFQHKISEAYNFPSDYINFAPSD